MKRLFHSLAVGAALLVLTGCASKEPLEYLPDGGGYLCLDMEQVRSEPGAKRLAALMEKATPMEGVKSEQVKKVYISLPAGPGDQAYGVVVGAPGFAADAIKQIKSLGGIESSVDGMKGVKLNETTVLAVGDAGLAFGPSASAETLVRTSKKKNPGALSSPTFTKLTSVGGHAMSVVFNVEPMISKAGQQLTMLSQMNAKGTEALKQMKYAGLTADYAEQPKIVLTAFVDEKAAPDLAQLANQGLQMAKMQLSTAGANVPPGVSEMLKSIEAKADTDGVKVTFEVPKEQAEQQLTQLEKLMADMPKDPEKRKEAIQKALMSGAISGRAAAPAAPQAPGYVPGATTAAPAAGVQAAPTGMQQAPPAVPAQR